MAYYCLHELHWTPSTFLRLPRAERAFVAPAEGVFVAAAASIRAKEEAKRRKEAERRSKHR